MRDRWYTGFVDALGAGGLLGQVEGGTVAEVLAWLCRAQAPAKRHLRPMPPLLTRPGPGGHTHATPHVVVLKVHTADRPLGFDLRRRIRAHILRSGVSTAIGQRWEAGMTGNRLTEEHLEILRNSGLINTDVTLNQLLEAGVELGKLDPDPDAEPDEPMATRLVGPWYAYEK